jgi:hypothetical protein
LKLPLLLGGGIRVRSKKAAEEKVVQLSTLEPVIPIALNGTTPLF